jgi:hypothetical protein
VPVVEPEAEKHIRVLQFAEMGALEQALMLLNRAANLSLFAVQIAQDQMDLERVACRFRGGAQLLDGLVDLIRDEEVEPQHVMR